jgi:glycosyltransferase involved in cell wall biosynthesis
MAKAYFISSFIGIRHTGGSILSYRNLNLCHQIFGQPNVKAVSFSYREKTVDDEIEFFPSYHSKFQSLTNYLLGYTGGFTRDNYRTILSQIIKDNYNVVFLDGSLLGQLAEDIKKLNPKICVICFFHNIETSFFRQYARKNPAYLMLLKPIANSENRAVQYADINITLTERDANGIEKRYGKKADFVIPNTIPDLHKQRAPKDKNKNKLQLLFTGSAFYANIEAAQWLVDELMPCTGAFLTIAGNGMNQFKSKWEKENIRVVGFVSDMADVYNEADIVLAPLFKGGGMKLKIAEALMFGKPVIGSKEAWQGYTVENGVNGFIAETKNDFLNIITSLSEEKLRGCSIAARWLYEQRYSPRAEQRYIQNLLPLLKTYVSINS